jgi:hypothetical protein
MSLTKATFSMIDGACINVLDYGAVADATWSSPTASGTDNLAAFNAAIADAVSKKINMVVIPAGSYYLSSGIILPHGIQLKGYGCAHLPFYAGGGAGSNKFGTVLLIAGQAGADCLATTENTGYQGLFDLTIYNVGSVTIRSVVSVVGSLYPRMSNVGFNSLIVCSGAGLYISSSAVAPSFQTLWGAFHNVVVEGSLQLRYGLQIEGTTLANSFVSGQFAGSDVGAYINSQANGTAFHGVKFDALWDGGTYVPLYKTEVVAIGNAYLQPVIHCVNGYSVTFSGCYVEQVLAPATYDDGVNGSASLVGGIVVESTSDNCSFINTSFHRTYVKNDSDSVIFDVTTSGVGNTGIRIASRPIPQIQGDAFSILQSIPTATWTKVEFNSFGAAIGLSGSLSFNVTTDEVVIQHTGIYQFNIQVALTGWTPGAATEYARIRSNILVSGGVNLTGVTVTPTNPAVPLTLTMSFTRRLNAGDTVFFELFQNSGTNKTVLEAGQTHIDVVQLN